MELIVKKEQGLKKKTTWGVGRGFISRILLITKTLTNATFIYFWLILSLKKCTSTKWAAKSVTEVISLSRC